MIPAIIYQYIVVTYITPNRCCRGIEVLARGDPKLNKLKGCGGRYSGVWGFGG